MTFQRDIPVSALSPANQAVDLRNNFSSLDTVFSKNHIGFNAFNQGDHEKMIYQSQVDDPVITQDLTVLYAKNDSQTIPQPQLFLKIKSFLPTTVDSTSAENTPMQISHNTVNVAGPQYQSFIAGGYKVYIGQTNNITAAITLTNPPSELIVVFANAAKGLTVADAFFVKINSNSQFQIQSTNSSLVNPYTVSWFAIGKI